MEEQHRRREDDWFRQNERKLLEAAHAARDKRERERAAKEQEAERARLRELHYLKCPKCGHDMLEEDLSGVLVDRCTFCEGLYFDANELEDLFLRQREERRSLIRRLLRI